MQCVDIHMGNILFYFQRGPNVSIGAGAVIGSGVRIRESIVLSGATILDHSLVLYSIVGRGSHVGQWTRVEGTPCDPNPNKPFAKMENPQLFNCDGRLNPSITILGEML
jgi:mannose-1-phosphate guanylyltransferase